MPVLRSEDGSTYLMKNLIFLLLLFFWLQFPLWAIDLNFTNAASIVNPPGTSEQVGAVYRYTNVGTEDPGGPNELDVDLILTLLDLNGGASYQDRPPANQNFLLSDVGAVETGSLKFQPTFDLDQFQFAEFNVRFVESGTLNAVEASDLNLVIIDIDSESNNNQNFTDMLFVDQTAGGTFTWTQDTNLVTNTGIMGTSGTSYRSFSLDYTTDLSGAPNITDNEAAAQSPYTVMLDFDTVGIDGINFAFGVHHGTGTQFVQDSARKALFDGSGTFTFVGATETIPVIPEPASLLLVGVSLGAVVLCMAFRILNR